MTPPTVSTVVSPFAPAGMLTRTVPAVAPAAQVIIGVSLGATVDAAAGTVTVAVLLTDGVPVLVAVTVMVWIDAVSAGGANVPPVIVPAVVVHVTA